MTDYTFDGVVLCCIVVTIAFVEAVLTLISIPKNGVLRSQREILMEKTNKELRLMLKGVKGINNKNKLQLVNLLIT